MLPILLAGAALHAIADASVVRWPEAADAPIPPSKKGVVTMVATQVPASAPPCQGSLRSEAVEVKPPITGS
jgi:hypothetical protein